MSELILTEGDSLKSLYLRGKAYLQKEEKLLAYLDFKEALLLDRTNAVL